MTGGVITKDRGANKAIQARIGKSRTSFLILKQKLIRKYLQSNLTQNNDSHFHTSKKFVIFYGADTYPWSWSEMRIHGKKTWTGEWELEVQIMPKKWGKMSQLFTVQFVSLKFKGRISLWNLQNFLFMVENTVVITKASYTLFKKNSNLFVSVWPILQFLPSLVKIYIRKYSTHSFIGRCMEKSPIRCCYCLKTVSV